MKTKDNTLFPAGLVKEALAQSFVKLNPRLLVRNPVMFTVELGTLVMLGVTLYTAFSNDASQGSFGYNLTVFVVLLLTVLFGNFAEAIAEARGKAQAESLRKTREDTPAKKVLAVGEIFTDEIKVVPPPSCAKATCSSASRAISYRPMAKSYKASPASMSLPSPAKAPR